MNSMDKQRLSEHKLHNDLQSLLLIVGLGALCTYPAWMLAGPFGAWLALLFVATTYVKNPAASSRLIMQLYRGEAITPHSAPQLYTVLKALAERVGLPQPPVLYYLPSRLMNAFTSGSPGNAAIGLSDGLLRRMDLRELAGVLGHELSHIAHEDTRVMAFADLTARITGYLSFAGLFLLILNLPLLLFTDVSIAWLPILVLLAAPSLSALLQLALSRTREFEADRVSAELTGDPEALASALAKMEHYQGRFLEGLLLPGQRIPDPSLLRTHPPTAERIQRLLDLREKRPLYEILPYWNALDPWNEIDCRDCAHPRWHRTGTWF